ncbi:MAG: LuxR C-terminal-related transcriptional regulator [Microthrixaceae bacterium]
MDACGDQDERGTVVAFEAFRPDPARRLVPEPSSAWVPRRRLVEALRAATSPMISVTAPAGWGKSTLLTQWAHADDRPFAWLELDQFDNDPVRLVRGLLASMSTATALDESARRALLATGHLQIPAMLPVLGQMFAAVTTPMVLVLDDVHLVHDPRSLAVIERLAEHVPRGSHLVVAGRASPSIGLGRRRAAGNVADVGVEQLVVTGDEAVELFDRAGLSLDGRDIEGLVARTDGWAAGLSLAALALKQGVDPAEFGGSDELVVEYLNEEVLVTLDAADVDLLMGAALLGRFGGPLCDAALARSGSGERIEALVRSGNLFIVPLDRTGTWYRFHHLFADFLKRRLLADGHLDASGIHARASEWYLDHDDADRAILHALEAGLRQRASSLLFDRVIHLVARGHGSTVRDLIDRFDVEEIAGSPRLLLVLAWGHIDRGEYELALEALELASAAAAEGDAEMVAALRASRGVFAAGSSVPEAAGSPPSTQMSGTGQWELLDELITALRLMLLGSSDEALELLRRCRLLSGHLPAIASIACAYSAILAEGRGDFDGATDLCRQARMAIENNGIVDGPLVAVVFASSAMIEARHGSREAALQAVERTLRMRDQVGPGHLRVQAITGTFLTHAYLALGDRAQAAANLDAARPLVDQMPQAVLLGDHLHLAEALLRPPDAQSPGQRVVSAAEARVLELLPTHHTLAEIADLLFVSRATVKTQVASIYRKLGVTNRSEAIAEARQRHLLPA